MGGARRLKLDGSIPNQLARAADAAVALERNGFDGGWTAEASHDPFLPLLLAAEHTSRLELGTNIAVAFARNPMIVANVGWDLQTYSKGRLILGLGTQIRPHIEKRFSMPWGHPARRMREFVAALRAIWLAWQDGTKLCFEGEFYTHKIMTPMFTPEPQPRAAAASASASAASASAANAIASACDVPASDGGSVVSAIVDTARQYHSRLNSGIAHSIAHC